MEAQAKQPILILGAGAQARETAGYFRSIPGAEIVGFADEFGGDGRTLLGRPHLNVANLAIDGRTALITAFGDQKLRRRFAALFKAQVFTNCISVPLNPSIRVGDDVTIAPGCSLTEDIVVGSHVLINIGCNLNHDVVIGDYATISPGVNIAGHARIGEG